MSRVAPTRVEPVKGKQFTSGKAKTRAFCPTCGSPVCMTFAAMPGTTWIQPCHDSTRCRLPEGRYSAGLAERP